MIGWLNWGVPAMKKVGRCHTPHSTPMIRLAISGDRLSSSFGRA